MTAGPENDHDAQPGKPSLRTALQGSRRFAVLALIVQSLPDIKRYLELREM